MSAVKFLKNFDKEINYNVVGLLALQEVTQTCGVRYSQTVAYPVRSVT